MMMTAAKPSFLEFIVPILCVVRHFSLIKQFAGREINRRYRMSMLGFAWMVLGPLFTLSIYTFVFGYVLNSRWGSAIPETPASFAIVLFAGLIVFWLFADVVSASPSAITGHSNLVTKAVFPVEILPIVPLVSAGSHALVSFSILLLAALAAGFELSITALWAPVVLLPFLILLLGIAWFLAALGVYIRDIGHLVGLAITGALFLSPVFYSVSQLSENLRALMMINPITFIIEQMRATVLMGQAPDLLGLSIYFSVAWVVAALGLAFFRLVSKGFADVL
ncbi:MAG: hypothetical protein VR70_06645 [Rhodospirillaceae bacterium BRH_c57]|nr:MAG: hypothetical protein VR70_06645 [Rhodospirillaceae bacterium BRH_c57]